MRIDIEFKKDVPTDVRRDTLYCKAFEIIAAELKRKHSVENEDWNKGVSRETVLGSCMTGLKTTGTNCFIEFDIDARFDNLYDIW